LTLSGDYILLTRTRRSYSDVEAIATRTNAVIVSNAEIADMVAKGFQSHPMNMVEGNLILEK
jgi:hypothetical protein